MSASQFLTTSQAAERLAVTIEQIVTMIRTGNLRAINISVGSKSRWRIASSDLEAFIAARTHKPSPVQPRRRRKMPAPKVDYFADS